MTLTPDDLKRLRAPFTSAAVKFRADAKFPDSKKRVRCLVYIDSRLVMERAAELDPNWQFTPEYIANAPSDPLGVSQFAPTIGRLTILGTTHEDVGTIANKGPSSMAAKAAVSDALKRAGVQFGIGAYLYALPSFHVDEGGYWTGKDRDGKEVVKGLTVRGVNQLRGAYELQIGRKEFQDRFGFPVDYGDIADDERSATPELVDGGQTTLPLAAKAKR